jgi:pimeloyl-ACP methyl ester carboxylesterase
VPSSDYWASGSVPLLELIPACDPFKPKAHWQELHNQFPDRVTTVVIDDASHALFPEQPDMVADAVLSWLARNREDSGIRGGNRVA